MINIWDFDRTIKSHISFVYSLFLFYLYALWVYIYYINQINREVFFSKERISFKHRSFYCLAFVCLHGATSMQIYGIIDTSRVYWFVLSDQINKINNQYHHFFIQIHYFAHVFTLDSIALIEFIAFQTCLN